MKMRDIGSARLHNAHKGIATGRTILVSSLGEVFDEQTSRPNAGLLALRLEVMSGRH